MKKMNREPDQIQEVFANFGLASYQAQCLEKQIAILLSFTYSSISDMITKFRADDLLDTNLEQTFGALVKQLINRVVLPTDMSEKLERSVEKRNWLAHHYWWDRASEFNTYYGREQMLTELKELAVLFEELDEFFTSLFKNWAVDKGLTQNDFETALKKLLSEPTPPRKKKGKLNKEEKLIGVYSYTSGGGKTLLFELEDHSFWSLCDCGLTYGPEKSDSLQLIPIPKFKKLLPAIINPRPKGAKDWSYIITFSTGSSIKVSPSEKDRKFTFKYSLIHNP